MSGSRGTRRFILLAVLTAACARDLRVAPARDDAATTLAGDLTVSPRVAILAVAGTQQLSASAVSLTGTPLTDLDSVAYQLNSVSDTVRVQLRSSGLVTGRAASTATVLVNAFGYKAGVAAADQALVLVTAAVIPGLTLNIHPVGADSAKLASGTTKNIVPVLTNPTTGASVPNPPMRYNVRPEDIPRLLVYIPNLRSIAGLTIPSRTNATPSTTNGIVPMSSEGSAWVYGALTAYGTALQDSVLYTFSYPYALTMFTMKTNLAITNTFAGRTVTLAHAAVITFQNFVIGTDPLQITYTFDNPAAATAATPPSTVGGASGNLTPLGGTQSAKRQFLTPGTYHWTATGSGGPAPWPGQTLSGALVIK